MAGFRDRPLPRPRLECRSGAVPYGWASGRKVACHAEALTYHNPIKRILHQYSGERKRRRRIRAVRGCRGEARLSCRHGHVVAFARACQVLPGSLLRPCKRLECWRCAGRAATGGKRWQELGEANSRKQVEVRMRMFLPNLQCSFCADLCVGHCPTLSNSQMPRSARPPHRRPSV